MDNSFDIAIIGMSCRFPGANDLDTLWNNLANGIESISRFTDEELKQSGIPDSLINNPNYIKAAPIIDGPGLFDAKFFGFTPMEAKNMDPQHRILLESAHQALEHSGYVPEKFNGRISVFTGSAMNTYFMNQILRSKFTDEYIPTLIGNDKDFLSTRISYKLNLKGPSINVQTACSTSIVAVHLACQSLITEESDMAIAGAVSVKAPHKAGYICDGGGIVSPDAHVRAFDKKANGTVFGSGCGVVVLKRLSDAVKDNDTIYAVIKGSAINNDGSEKAGYTAPSVNSQANAVIEALSLADVDAKTISYIEAHGSGTPLGDPIEFAALTKAFRNSTDDKNFCAVGSVKTNFGHLDVAAGMAGLIKTILSLKNKKIPPSINYSEPNPEIDFENSPFFVAEKLSDWKSSGVRRCGVMSTGMGGTNAFLILEEAPSINSNVQSDLPNILILSAKTESALDQSTVNLKGLLEKNDNVEIRNAVYTLQQGRKAFDYRRFFVCKDRNDAIEILNQENSKRIFSGKIQNSSKRPVIFLFPGIGDHYVGMGYDLYQNVKIFKRAVDECAAILNNYIDTDIRQVLYPKDYMSTQPANSGGIDLKKMLASRVNKSADEHTQKLNQTLYAQPALFTIEYALAKLWMNLGIIPDAIIGHSMGEYVAACLAGVFSLEDALKMIAVRAKLVNNLPQGGMLAVTLTEKELIPLLGEELSISLINSPNLCVVAGAEEGVARFEEVLKEKGVLYRQVQNAHAFHSKMLDPIFDEFVNVVKQIKLKSPQIPYISNLTGNWISENEAASPVYWAKHATNTARFSDALQKAWQINNCILLEAGPGNTLGVLAMQHPESRKVENPLTISSLRPSYDNQPDINYLLGCIGKLWLSGVEIDWNKLYENEKPKRIPLPTYPFQKENFWIEEKPAVVEDISSKSVVRNVRNEFKDWFYIPSWKRSNFISKVSDFSFPDNKKIWLIILDEMGIGNQIKNVLEKNDNIVITVSFKDSFSKIGEYNITINPKNSEHYTDLFRGIKSLNINTLNIIHAGCLSNYEVLGFEHKNNLIQYLGFYSLLFISQAISKLNISLPVNIGILSSQVHQVTGDERLCPEKALILGPCGVIPKEFSNLKCFNVDVLIDASNQTLPDEHIKSFIGEFADENPIQLIAYRGKFRWIKSFEQVDLGDKKENTLSTILENKGRIRKKGVYLITGGTGGIGLTIAKYLAEKFQARLVLTQKSEFPEKSNWQDCLTKNSDDKILTQKINRVIELEELGSEVLVLKAEASDKVSMADVFAKTGNTFGKINGVIHCAGIVKAGIIAAKEKESIKNVFAPKVDGSLILYDLIKYMNLDFLTFCSSTTAVNTPYAEVDYSAANAFLDSFAQYINSSSQISVFSVNWPGWSEIGQLVKLKVLKGTEKWKDEAIKKAITPKEGLEAFKLIINSNYSQVVVSPEPIENVGIKIDPTKLFNLSQIYFKNATEEKNVDVKSTVADSNKLDSTENSLLLIWKDILGVKEITNTDNFFELGGHSLLAIQLISAIRNSFRIQLNLEDIFNASNLNEMADKINKLMAN